MRIQLRMQGGFAGLQRFEPFDAADFANEGELSELPELIGALPATPPAAATEGEAPEVRTEGQFFELTIEDAGLEPSTHRYDQRDMAADPRIKKLHDFVWRRSRPRSE